MRPKRTLIGYRHDKWVAVEELEQQGRKRRLKCKCVVCGSTKEFLADKLKAGTVAACACTDQANRNLPKNTGIACSYRSNNCAINSAGACCYYCRLRTVCEEKCLNNPELCGSFFAEYAANPPATDPELKPLIRIIKD